MQAQVFNFKDPFDRSSWEVFKGGEGLTVRERLKQIFPDFVEFDKPTFIQLNGKDLMRAEWDTTHIQESDVIAIMPVIGDGGAIFALILVSILVSVALVMFLEPPIIDTTNTKDADPVYSLSGQKNKFRINEPIEKHYGLCRIYPSYAAKSYNQFIGNDQYLYSLFCIGLGEYTILEELIGDSEISNFQEVETEIYQQGERVTLFPTQVETVEEVNNIELFAPNQTGDVGEPDEGDYTGFIGGFPANSSGTTTKKIEHDVVFDSGLYTTNKKGRTLSRSVTVRFEHREIDNAGSPIGGWELSVERTFTLATTTPQRFSLSFAITEGRYEVRGVRINNSDLSNRTQDSIKWLATRSFIEGEQNFPPNVMLWAVKAKATNNLNSQTQTLFNLKVQSKIPVYNTETELWTLTETRNPVWVFCDILRSEYGMRLEDRFLDLTNLAALAQELETEQIRFDFTFDQRGKVWDACKTVLNVAKAKALMHGIFATAVRDKPDTIPVAGFNQNNIIKDSFKVETRLTRPFKHDGLLIEYRDAEKWTTETVFCGIGESDTGINPKQVQMLGCTDRTRAYRWGLYQRAVELFVVDNFSFSTGIEGLILTYGDLIAIKHDYLPTSADFIDEQTGRLPVGAINAIYNEFEVFVETQIVLPYDAVFTEPEVNAHFISIRKKDGTLSTPMVATQTDNPRIISIEQNLDLAEYIGSENSEQPTYFFGANSNLYQLAKIVGITPKENYEVEISAIPYDSRIYEFDDLTAPVLNRLNPSIAVPNFPVITDLTVITNTEVLTVAVVSWTPARGATSYVVESSVDGVDYVVEGVTTNPSFRLTNILAGTLWVRVYGINLGAGAKTTWTGIVGTALYPPIAPTNLTTSQPFDDDELALIWDVDLIASSYNVKIKQGATLLREVTTTTNQYLYRNSVAKLDAINVSEPLERALTVEVKSVNTEGVSEAVIETFTNPLPIAIATIGSSFISAAGNERTYRITPTLGANYDLEKIYIHLSMTTGFTPDGGNLKSTVDILTNPTGVVDSTIDTGDVIPATVYCKLGTKDIWGEEIVYSAQFTITG